MKNRRNEKLVYWSMAGIVFMYLYIAHLIQKRMKYLSAKKAREEVIQSLRAQQMELIETIVNQRKKIEAQQRLIMIYRKFEPEDIEHEDI